MYYLSNNNKAPALKKIEQGLIAYVSIHGRGYTFVARGGGLNYIQ